ncbi:MAG TPA: hormogonium polysaccharide biosynthesis protein HpsA [Nostocaceae cyanobacterium]|nr:hormogonium polysaccharide biosynthesis protein HpsA [Nostocaceae cyanobacterium]
MSRKSQHLKAITKRCQRVGKKVLSAINKQIIWLLRTISGTHKRRETSNAGFVLPTVVMVSIVVILLSAAVLFRSFERSKNASNVRVSEVVLQAASPALERAKAKISELFTDPTLPRAVPSNTTLYNTLTTKLKAYTLGDETPVVLAYDIDKNNSIDAKNPDVEKRETLQTAWKFPVDTNNNRKFDSYIIYGIYFRNAPQSAPRARSPLDARTPPMLLGQAGNNCDTSGDTSASLVGSSGWYKIPSGELKKSFFVYAATVPITDKGTLGDSYEKYEGNRGFAAIEMQQDVSQIPITNNAVVYEDDLDITPGPTFRLNGRIVTNSNLFTGKNDKDITLFQVSSPNSCYYERENSKIVVGGNVATNTTISSSERGGTRIDLYKENSTPTTNQSLTTTNKTTSNIPNEIAYNSQAYAERINLLVEAQFAKADSSDPQEVKDNIQKRLLSDPNLDQRKVRKDELKIYFRKRTRRVPFKEVPYGDSAIGSFTIANVLEGSGNSLRPPDAWIYPTDTNTKLTLNKAQLPAKDPDEVDNPPVTEVELGDRIVVGNNLPELKWDNTKEEFVGEKDPEDITGTTWTGSSKTRTRTTRVRQIADLGVTERDGFWENAAASPRFNELDVVGGLRIVTGAGVYSPLGSGFTDNLNNLRPSIPVPNDPSTNDTDPNTQDVNEDQFPQEFVVWPDTMPMLIPNPNDPLNPSQAKRGDLVMRATAVYHYNADPYDPNNGDNEQKPIACVSSYYDSTDKETARNQSGLPDVSGEVIGGLPSKARSNNGVVYAAPTTTATGIARGQTVDTNGLFTVSTTANDVSNSGVSLIERLKYQANLVFPNGRLVNPLLRQALLKPTADKLTLSEQSALDATICAIQIADGSLSTNTVIPHGAIKETAFLDARQIKAIDKGNTLTGNYDLEVEQRQPLEIRATVIDLDKLRKQSITGTWSNEYLLPNSGIIYAARDDAQKDRSANSDEVSASDYRIDPERRPNGIMLINGSDLSRQNNYRAEEKGLILATELPVYVKGNFNLHDRQEFTDLLNPTNYDTKFYSRTASTRDSNFACRPNDPRLPKCTTGEKWRPASVIADAVTLLSDNFREGFRDEGDYDLRNNRSSSTDVVLNRLKAGFWNNNFLTSSKFASDNTAAYISSTTATKDKNSSYVNNFVTPIQRRGNFPEYVMEMCYKIVVSECGPRDWYVGSNKNGIDPFKYSSDVVGDNANTLLAGTTAIPAQNGFERFPRRVAFRRDTSSSTPPFRLLNSAGTAITYANPSANPSPTNQLSARPIPLGIIGGKVDNSGTTPDINPNALWYAFTSNTSNLPSLSSGISYDTPVNNASLRLFYRFPYDLSNRDFPGARDPVADPTNADLPYDSTAKKYTFIASDTRFKIDTNWQPLLEPVVQLQITTQTPSTANSTNYSTLANASSNSLVKSTNWLNRATETTFNLVVAAGDTPARVSLNTSAYELNGGLHNFVRFLENWDSVNANISGSFIQFKRSIYATAPYQVLIRPGASTAARTPGNLTSFKTFNFSPNPSMNIESLFFRQLSSSRPGYNSDSTFISAPAGEAPYYMAPVRNWGFDVGLLAQNPDLFAQRFAIPSTDPPNEYYREVGKDDPWVQTLLCAFQYPSSEELLVKDGGFGSAITLDGKSLNYALPSKERPTTCPRPAK